MPAKNNQQKFQLKPKHLIWAVMAVCFAAIIALIAGVATTFRPHGEERAQEEQVEKEQKNTNRVEVLKPQGSQTQGTIVINPEVANTPPQPQAKQPASLQDDTADESIFETAVAPAAAERSYSDAERAEQQRRARWRREQREMERRRTRASAQSDTAAKPETVAPAAPSTPATAPAQTAAPAPVERPRPVVVGQPRREVRQEQHEAPKPAPAPAPKPQPQQKEVIDNLF